MLNIDFFKLTDILDIELEKHDRMLIGNPYIMEGLARNAKMKSGFTTRLNGQVISCAGVSVVFQNRGEIWGVFSPEAKEIKKIMLKETKKHLQMLVLRFELKRLEATARCDWPQAANFLKHLGFECEGRKRKFELDGTDAWLYARVE